MEQTLTNREIVESQLRVALDFYFEDKELVSALTLAGAAEEILGRTIKDKKILNAVERNAKLYSMFSETMLGEKTEPKVYITFSNRARNNMKHKMDEVVTFDFKIEVRNMLTRALDNYRNLYKVHHEDYGRFKSV